LVEIHLFGDLRYHAVEPQPVPGTVMHLPLDGDGTVGQVLSRVGIAPEDVGNVFLNGHLLPRSAYPITLGYPLAADQPLTLERFLATPVRSGDRVGIFPRNMGVVVV
jgi:hypothetical protein